MTFGGAFATVLGLVLMIPVVALTAAMAILFYKMLKELWEL